MSGRLKANALSLVDTVTLAVAGTAPSYSLNASTAALIAAVGLAAPGALLWGALPMFGISFAFKYLNEWRADAGAVYAWVGRSTNPSLGFLSAWTFLSLSTAFLVAAALPVGVTTLALVAPRLQENVLVAALAGGVWFTGVALLTIRGVHLAASVQRVMTAIEALALVTLAVGAFVKFGAQPASAPSWSWILPSSFSAPGTFMAGMLVAVFYYFGWDVSSNVAEETQGSQRTPGASGVLGMVAIVAAFLVLQAAFQVAMTREGIEQNGTNLLAVFGDAVLPHPFGKIAILAVFLSTIGTIETQMTQCARTLFSMGRDRVIHERFAEIHPRFQTPWLAGLVVTALALLLLVLSSASASVGGVMKSLISAIGLMVSLYYGMSGIACVVYYRKTLRGSLRTLVMRGIWPAASALFLLVLAVLQLPSLGFWVSLLTVSSIAVGCVPMLFYRRKYRSAFYTDPAQCAPEVRPAAPPRDL